MRRSWVCILLWCIEALVGCHDHPTETGEDRLTKLWEIQLESLASTGFSVYDNSLIFKTSSNITEKLYKVTKDGKLLQSASTGGCTRGIPIVRDSIVYTGNCDNSLYALDVRDLSIVWSATDFGFMPMPIAGENFVYATDRNVIRALAKSDGHTVWYLPIVGLNTANPVVSGDTLYFTTWKWFADGYLYAINTADTTILYRRSIPYDPSKSQGGGSMGGVEIWNGRLFVAGSNRNFYCFDKATSDSIWAFETDAPMDCTPRVSDGIVYFGTLNGTCYALEASTGVLKWTYHARGSIVRDPAFYQSYVMFKSLGDLLILDKSTGRNILTLGSDELAFDNAFWDSDGKIFANGYKSTGLEGMLIGYQFK